MGLATANSTVLGRLIFGGSGEKTFGWSRPALFFAVCLGLFASVAAPAARAADPAAFAAAAQKAYRDAQARHKHEPDNVQAAWQFARACFDLAEFAASSGERADLAQDGIAASRHALARDPNSAAAHYYLGLNLGQLARTKLLGALKIVPEMEREFLLARRLDERFDYLGPDRCLGLLYRDTPAFGSVGSRSKARQHLQRAVELASHYPENRLNLAETFLKWGDRADARRELKVLEAAWPAARSTLTGPAWAPSWADWEQRLKTVKKNLEGPPKPLETPRH